MLLTICIRASGVSIPMTVLGGLQFTNSLAVQSFMT